VNALHCQLNNLGFDSTISSLALWSMNMTTTSNAMIKNEGSYFSSLPMPPWHAQGFFLDSYQHFG
jgi:hypothetical protein